MSLRVSRRKKIEAHHQGSYAEETPAAIDPLMDTSDMSIANLLGIVKNNHPELLNDSLREHLYAKIQYSRISLLGYAGIIALRHFLLFQSSMQRAAVKKQGRAGLPPDAFMKLICAVYFYLPSTPYTAIAALTPFVIARHVIVAPEITSTLSPIANTFTPSRPIY